MLSAKEFVDEKGQGRGPKEPHLSIHELRQYETRKIMTKGKLWRNHFKFVGMLPDFRGFENVKMNWIIPEKHFKEKRTLILIFQWLAPDTILLKLIKVCKKFYILTWNMELLNTLCFNSFGLRWYTEVRYRCAKRLKELKDIASGDPKAKCNSKSEDKPRWLIEDS